MIVQTNKNDIIVTLPKLILDLQEELSEISNSDTFRFAIKFGDLFNKIQINSTEEEVTTLKVCLQEPAEDEFYFINFPGRSSVDIADFKTITNSTKITSMSIVGKNDFTFDNYETVWIVGNEWCLFVIPHILFEKTL